MPICERLGACFVKEGLAAFNAVLNDSDPHPPGFEKIETDRNAIASAFDGNGKGNSNTFERARRKKEPASFLTPAQARFRGCEAPTTTLHSLN